MDVEHPQGVANHENADGNHQQGAGHRAEREERTKPAKQGAEQGVCNNLCDQKEKNGKCRIRAWGGCGRNFLAAFSFARLRRVRQIILLDLVRERTRQQSALHRQAT